MTTSEALMVEDEAHLACEKLGLIVGSVSPLVVLVAEIHILRAEITLLEEIADAAEKYSGGSGMIEKNFKKLRGALARKGKKGQE